MASFTLTRETSVVLDPQICGGLFVLVTVDTQLARALEDGSGAAVAVEAGNFSVRAVQQKTVH